MECRDFRSKKQNNNRKARYSLLLVYLNNSLFIVLQHKTDFLLFGKFTAVRGQKGFLCWRLYHIWVILYCLLIEFSLAIIDGLGIAITLK